MVFTYLVGVNYGRSDFQVSVCTRRRTMTPAPSTVFLYPQPKSPQRRRNVNQGSVSLVSGMGKKCSSALLFLLCIICLVLYGPRMCHIFA